MPTMIIFVCNTVQPHNLITSQPHKTMTKLKSLMYIVPLVATSLWGCGPGGSSFKIKGQFSDFNAAEMYMYNLSEDNIRFDTINIVQGEFTYTGECNDITPYMLVFPNAVEHIIFVAPGKSISYEVSSRDLKNYVVKGTDENKLMNDFRQKVSAEPKNTQKIAEQFIKDNLDSPVAIYLFDRYYVQNKEINQKEIDSILKLLKKQQPKNIYIRNLESKIKYKDKCKIGNKIPNLTVNNSKGKKIKVWEKKDNKNTILIFWADWCNGSLEYLWKTRDIIRNNKDKVKGRFVGISLDTEYNRFQNDVRSDSALNIQQYCDGLAFESPSVKNCGITNIPCYIIVDKNRKIIAKGEDINNMLKDINTYLLDK